MKHKLTYSTIDVLMADPDTPTPAAKQVHQLTRMWQGLRALELESTPRIEDWIVVSDAVNLMETLVKMGKVQDTNDSLTDAMKVLEEAGRRNEAGYALRLSGAGIQIIRGVLEDYAEALEQLPHRTMIVAHRKTEQHMFDILNGKLNINDTRFV